MSSTTFRSCFIAAPFGAELFGLKQILDNRSIDWKWAESRQYQSSSALGDIKETIRGVDLVLLVLSGADDPNLSFEVGLAVGLNKPVIAISTKPMASLPSLLTHLPTINSTSPDFSDIEFQFDVFLTSLRPPYWPRSRPTPHYLERLRESPYRKISRSEYSSAFEHRMISLLAPFCDHIEAGLSMEASSQPWKADALAWIRGLEFGSPSLPVLVEVKARAQKNVADVAYQLSKVLEKSELFYALGIVRGRLPPRCKGSDRGLVFLVGSDDLEELAANGTFVEQLVALRNRNAHGAP